MSRQGSAASVGSRKSTARYKSVGAGGVDESLFGGGKGPAQTGGMSKAKLEKLVNEKPTHVETDSIVITGNELDRLRKLATVVNKADIERERQEAEAAKAAAQAKARERKEKMIAMEAKRKANLAKSDLEMEDESKMSNLLENAERARDEQLDDVKHMNQMMLYAKCVTIRDAQLLEKQMIQKEKADHEKAIDMAMEQERLKALELTEERERAKMDERLRGAAIIRMQIEQREKERIRQEELRDQERDHMLKEIERMKHEQREKERIREQEQLDMEREAMLRQIERLKQAEVEKEAERKVLNQQLLEEAAAGNAEQIKRKALVKAKIAEEEQRIADYIAEKDRKEAARMEELEEEVRRKAEETARLRAMQEKAADKASEADALRAKRAQEDYERAWRKKERDAVEKKERMLKEVMESREQMKKDREKVHAEAAQAEKIQFHRILVVQKAAEAAEQERELADKQRRLAHNEDIRRQIADAEESRQRARQEFLEEGQKIRYSNDLEKKRLQAIKQRKMAELQRSGVPEKYLSELSQKKMT